ncbi:MAG: hypothetical protein K9K30_11720 [Burkholderiaceae bacterium]|nr:hypothetical protein [Sulfuritalea sp.]MCF8175897.1 hypothetical protein [Burkholderiaceae bacterium]MCF8183487.1 hypothetical protein [Polynucleobacter sp.]
MFSKILSRFQEAKSGHPLGSDENLDALMEDIPESDPGRLLFDVDERLAGMDLAVAEIGAGPALHALLRLDQFSRAATDELLKRYLTAGKREYLADSIWSALETHAAHFFQCYRASLKTLRELKTDDDKLRAARSATRALRAWTLRKKLQRFRYRTPSAKLWADAHELLQLLLRMGVQQTRVMPYRDDGETTPLHEYLIGLYLEFVPVGNLVPQQIELAEGILRTCGSLEMVRQPGPSTTHQIDLGADKGPQRFKQTDAPVSSMYYCSVLNLRNVLAKLAVQVARPADTPEWLGSMPIRREQIESGILILMKYWAPVPPKRGDDRSDESADLKAVLGFSLARRMIAAAHFARMGRSLEYRGDDINRLFDESRFGTVAPQDGAEQEEDSAAAAPESANPIDILRKLELGGDKAQMESWVQVDGSETGIGVTVPAILPRHRIGLLVCFREEDGMDWRMGVIRRIGRDAANRPGIGLETLGWPSICAMVKPGGEASAWTHVADSGHGWTDAVIVSLEGAELVLPAGAFVAGMEVDVRSEEGVWRVRLESLLDRGPDYDRIEFTRIS